LKISIGVEKKERYDVREGRGERRIVLSPKLFRKEIVH